MARTAKSNTNQIVHLRERVYKSGIRFYLEYTQSGEQIKESLNEDIIPLVRGGRYVLDKKGNPKVNAKGEYIETDEYKLAKRKAQAIQWQRTLEIQEGRLGIQTEANKNLMLSDWIQTVADELKRRERKNLHRHTYSRKLIVVKSTILQYTHGKDIKLSAVDKNFLLGYMDWLQNGYVIQRHVQNAGQYLSSGTANDRYKTLVYALTKAVKEGKIPTNPDSQIEKNERIKVSHKEREFLTIDELNLLQNTPTRAHKTMQVYLFMCYTGLRISDAKSLKWSDVRNENGDLVIRKRQQKTQENVYIPLPKKAVELLPERGDKSGDDLVFDDLPTEPSMNRNLKIWAKKAGIDKNLTLHTARHTYCTMLLTKGVDLYTVSKLAGHTNPQTTQIYAKIVDEKKIEAVHKLDE